MPAFNSPYRGTLTSDSLKKIPSVKQAPGSALRALKVNNNLMSEIGFFLDRHDQGKGFYLYQGRQYQNPVNVWVMIARVFFENFCYHKRACAHGAVNLAYLPNCADSIAATVLQEQLTGEATKGKLHYTKLHENVIMKLINIYDRISACVLQIARVKHVHGRFEDRVLDQQSLDQVLGEIHFVKFKIAGWLLNWRRMVTFDEKTEDRLSKIEAEMQDTIDEMAHSRDEDIIDAYNEYVSSRALMGAFCDFGAELSGGVTDSSSTASLSAEEGEITSDISTNDSGCYDGELTGDVTDTSSVSSDSMHDVPKPESIYGDERVYNMSLLSDDVDQVAKNLPGDTTTGGQASSILGHEGESLSVAKGVVYAIRSSCLKRSRGDLETHEWMPCKKLDQKIVNQAEGIHELSDSLGMTVSNSARQLEQQLSALEEYQVLNERFMQIDQGDLPEEVIAITTFHSRCKRRVVTLDQACQWRSSVGKAFYVPKAIPADSCSIFEPGDIRLVTDTARDNNILQEESTCNEVKKSFFS